jgi:transcriptional regulator with XRE-family HTH domain
MPPRSKAFAQALRSVRKSLGESQDTFGARLDVARRTLTRWEIRGELPPMAQRKHLATVLGDVRRDLQDELLESLELGDEFAALVSERAPDTQPRDPAAALAGVDAAVLAMAEELDVGPRKLRAALTRLLVRLEAAGLSLAAARGVVDPPVGNANTGLRAR